MTINIYNHHCLTWENQCLYIVSSDFTAQWCVDNLSTSIAYACDTSMKMTRSALVHTLLPILSTTIAQYSIQYIIKYEIIR